MTGLDPNNDVILEIAALITDNNLSVVAQMPTQVIHYDDEVLARMGAWCKDQHTKSGLVDAVRASTISLDEAEERVLAFLRDQCAEKDAPLAGNSVYKDRVFLARYMPKVDAYLHYRIIDVSSLKELVRRWYPNNRYTQFKKSEKHRAHEDILESIAELVQYREQFFRA